MGVMVSALGSVLGTHQSLLQEGTWVSGKVGSRSQTPHFPGTCAHLTPPAKALPDPSLQTSPVQGSEELDRLPLGALATMLSVFYTFHQVYLSFMHTWTHHTSKDCHVSPLPTV